jgi:hypothetical protein
VADDALHGLVVIPLHLQVGYLAVALRRHDPVVAQEILDADQRRMFNLYGSNPPQLAAIR